MTAPKPIAQWPAVFNTVYAMPESLRPALIDFALTSPRHSDLVNTFPYAAVILATGRGSPAARGEALWLMQQERGLKAIGQALDLPGWTRRVHPRAAGIALPRGVNAAPGCPIVESLGRRMPDEPTRQISWLYNLNRVFAYPDSALRRWLILRAPLSSHFIVPMIDIMAAYKFYSDNPGLEASSTIPTGWTDRACWSGAVGIVHGWMRDAAIDALWRGSGLSRVAPEPLKLGSYTITPIMTQHSLEAEADRMDNCLRTYWLHVLTGAARLFAIAGPRTSRAVFDVRMHAGEHRIVQIKGIHNKTASRTLVAAAEAWVADGLPGAPDMAGRPKSIKALSGPWHDLWPPFLEAHKHLGIFPANRAEFPRIGLLHTELAILERRSPQGRGRRRRPCA